MSSRLEDVIQRGVAAARPAAATVPVGTLYYSTDTEVLERSTGSAWENYSAAAASGDVSGPASALDQAIVLFDGATGKLIQDSGVLLTTLAPLTPRVTTITSSATPIINTNTADAVSITALAAAITSMTTNLSGTPVNFQKLLIRIKDDGTPRAITWGASYDAKGAALPMTTVAGKVLTITFLYDTVAAKWGCIATAQET